MRIAHIGFSDQRGGAARAMWRLHEAQLRAGYDSHVIVVRQTVTGDPRVIGCPPRGWNRQTRRLWKRVGSSRVDLQACKLEYSIVSPK